MTDEIDVAAVATVAATLGMPCSFNAATLGMPCSFNASLASPAPDAVRPIISMISNKSVEWDWEDRASVAVFQTCNWLPFVTEQTPDGDT